jgi:hypothetical protein
VKGLVFVVLVVIGLAAAPAWAGSVPAGKFGVGDSIMLSASDEFGAFDWPVNAEVGRQFSTGVRVVRSRASRGVLPRHIVVHLGTNGPIDPADCSTLVEAAGPRRRVFLVTVRVPRGWQDANNHILRACAGAFEKVHLIRWFAHSRRHAEWFAPDGYHLNAEGQHEYASYLRDRVVATLAGLRG